MTIGIYKLNFTGTDKVYIGQSRRLEKRLAEHISLLKSDSHTIKMQEAYKDFGEPSIEILCECSIEELSDFENETIEIWNAVDNGFNTCYKATDTPTCILRGEEHGMSKASNIQIIDIFNYLVSNTFTVKQISILTNVSVNIVYQIAEGVGHKWLQEVYPVAYEKLTELKGTRNTSAITKGIIYPNIISPEGEVFNVTNTRKFAREHNLNHSNLGRVLNSKANSHKGWVLASKKE